jgi:Flp pilus assembly protein TadD
MIADGRPWDYAALFWFGVAQYRTRDYAGAITTLERYSQERPGPWSHLIMAVAHHHLGHAAQAREHLEVARPLISNATGNDDMIAFLRSLLREAESLIARQR